MKKYKVGIIGFGHMHINNVASLFGEHPQVEWVACADTTPATPELRKAAYTRQWNVEFNMEKLGIPKYYDDYQEMLDKEEFDIIICTSENAEHVNVVEACAKAGVNICVEKPMAPTLEEGLRMYRACKANDVEMVINWPVTWSPAVRKVKELVDAGVIGRLLEVKWRAGHTGPLGSGAHHEGVSDTAAPMTGPERAATWWHQAARGGGSILDFCCYGSMLSRWMIGEQALSAIGMKTNLNSQYGDADDNSVIAVQYPGAMALFEGSWTTVAGGIPTSVFYGTEGTLVLDRKPGGASAVRLCKAGGVEEWIDCEPMAEDRDTVAKDLINHLETGEPVHITINMDFNMEVLAVLDAGVRSASSGMREIVRNPATCIG